MIFPLKVKCVVFDKTITLTIGKPVVIGTKLWKNIPTIAFYDKVSSVEVGCDISNNFNSMKISFVALQTGFKMKIERVSIS